MLYKTISYIQLLPIYLKICILYMTKHLYNNISVEKLIIVDLVILWRIEYAITKMYTKYRKAPIV